MRGHAAFCKGKLGTLSQRNQPTHCSKFLTGIEADSLIEGELFLKLERCGKKRSRRKPISLAPVKFKAL